MNKPRLILLISIISVALIGIIIIQIFWIKKAFRVANQEFDRNVNKVLENVIDELDYKNTYKIITKTLNEEELCLDSIVKQAELIKKQIPEKLKSIETELHQFELNLNDSFFFEDDKNINNKTEIKIDLSEYENNSKEFENSEIHIFSNIPDIEDINIDLDSIEMMISIDKISEVIENLAVEYEFNYQSVDDYIKNFSIDSLLDAEFEEKGVNVNYYFKIENKKNGKILETNYPEDENIKVDKFKVNIFPDNPDKQDYILEINLINRTKFIYGELSLMLFLSVIFTLIIIFAFATTIYTIIKQKKMSEIKSDFINNMTHEFKTPIATIQLAADTISNPKILNDKDKLLIFIEKIKEENKRMNSHVENILQAAIIDNKTIELNFNNENLISVIEDVIKKTDLLLKNKSGKISTDFQSDIIMAKIDRLHFSNVIFNLFDNAIKYSDKNPEITISAKIVNNQIFISVKDNGTGMTTETQRKVFDKFYRAEKGNIHNIKGFGLGLSYVKGIVEAHNGNIFVKSELGKGSVFTIILNSEKDK